MDKKLTETRNEKMREQMIIFITQTILQLDIRKLCNVYNFVMRIK